MFPYNTDSDLRYVWVVVSLHGSTRYSCAPKGETESDRVTSIIKGERNIVIPMVMYIVLLSTMNMAILPIY